MMIKHAVKLITPVCILVFLIALSPPALAEDSEYDFDVSEFEKKPYEIGGLAGLTPAGMLTDEKAALYRLK